MLNLRSKSHLFLFVILFLLGGVAINNVVVNAIAENAMNNPYRTADLFTEEDAYTVIGETPR